MGPVEGTMRRISDEAQREQPHPPMSHWIRPTIERIMKAFGSTRICCLVVALAGVCSLFLISQKLQPCDDAYITFRHVKNFLEFGRPSWNLTGDPVLGSTTPAFLFTLTLFCAVFRVDQVDQAALYLNATFHFLLFILAFLVGMDLLRKVLPALLLAALIGVNAVNVCISSAGFESSMFLATLFGSLYCVRLERDRSALFLSSLAPLIRPEGIVVVALVWGYIFCRRRFKKRLLLAFLPLPLLWLTFSTAYYGSPIPHTIHAKKKFPAIYKPYTGNEVNLVDRLPSVPSHAWDLWEHHAGSLLLSGSTSRDFETSLQKARRWIMFLGLPLTLLFIVVRPDGRIIYLLYPPMFLILFGWIGHTQRWYYPSFVVSSILILFVGWVRAFDYAFDTLPVVARKFVDHWKVPQIALLIIALLFVTVNNVKINHGEYDHRHRGALFPVNPWGALWDMWEIQRATLYRQAAEYLATRTDPSDVVLISEVGVFGYYYPGEVIDAIGLCTPAALDFYPPPEGDIRDPQGNYHNKGNNLTPTNMVMTLKPDFVVNSQFYTANLLRPGSPFLQEYREIHRFGRIWGEPVIIHERSSITTPN